MMNGALRGSMTRRENTDFYTPVALGGVLLLFWLGGRCEFGTTLMGMRTNVKVGSWEILLIGFI